MANFLLYYKNLSIPRAAWSKVWVCDRTLAGIVVYISLLAPELIFNFSKPCVQNVNNTGTKQVRIMKQTEFKKKRSVCTMFKVFSTYIC